MNMKYLVAVLGFTIITVSTVRGSGFKEEVPIIDSTSYVSQYNKDFLKDSVLDDGRIFYSEWKEITEPIRVTFVSGNSRNSKDKKKKGRPKFSRGPMSF
ncbi:exported protein of unknown function [Bartonella clarridgeiae 73]|uniref:Uncharacterized protein n=1 Tax=Bartonella clarridgeiae (strain CCUG 45776 / CIP 104772 / 73) TaxID=696125 RepID=E6YG87_BARC7|nr:hypothetical protein [Bartonella clarridgeiae]WCR55517.1 MAG: hypothetical protein PG977_000910 [Bartonella clarridgeiae]CBI75875.1 exported protein of unknown function [Bartonella clarridgeiae 73]